jgi:DNA-3-methyladenine glycosylase I
LDAGIIRNKLKVRSAVTNAIFGNPERIWQFSKYICIYKWKPIINNPKALIEVPATSPLSDTTDLKKAWFL